MSALCPHRQGALACEGRMAAAFGSSREDWLGMQSEHDLAVVADAATEVERLGPAVWDEHRPKLGALRQAVHLGDLYDTDVLEWSDHQARLLRQHAAGKSGNEVPDWDNIIDEVESAASEAKCAFEGLILQVLRHDLECEAWPLLPDVPHWRAEARLFRSQARRRWTTSMRRKIDLASIYTDALRAMPDTIDGQPPLPVPVTCPVTLDDLVADEP